MLPFEGQFPSSRCGNCILCSTSADFADNFYSTGLSLEWFTNTDWFIFSAKQFPEWLYTLWSFKEMCHQLFFKLWLEWQSLSFEWESFFYCLPKSKYWIICLDQQGSSGVKTIRNQGSGLTDTNHMMCLSHQSHTQPCSEEEAKEGALGLFQYKLRLKAGVCDPGSLGADWLGRKRHGRYLNRIVVNDHMAPKLLCA